MVVILPVIILQQGAGLLAHTILDGRDDGYSVLINQFLLILLTTAQVKH